MSDVSRFYVDPDGESRNLCDEYCVRATDYDAILDRVKRLEDALRRADLLVQLVTVRQVIDSGNSAIEAAGLDPWCINEGKATGDEHLSPYWIDAALNEAAR